jgi:predicted O-methyltransferase YrrM
VRKGRNVAAGNLRGWALEFGGLTELIERLPEFARAREAAGPFGTLPGDKLASLYLFLRFAIPDMAGDLIEFGAYRGGSALFMASLLKQTDQHRKIYACDTFAGMPAVNSDIDMHHPGDFSDTSAPALIQRRDQLGLTDYLEVVVGKFEDSLPGFKVGKQFSLVHIDCDIYQSIRFVLAEIEPHLVAGAYVVFDDPLHGSCLGALEACEEAYIQDRRLLAEQAFPHLVFRPKGA